jgi:hypothetical protein
MEVSEGASLLKKVCCSLLHSVDVVSQARDFTTHGTDPCPWGGGMLARLAAAAGGRSKPRGSVYFAAESKGPNPKGSVRGIFWDRRPAAHSTATNCHTSSGDGSIEVRADVTPVTEGAFRGAVAWVVGLLQSGCLQHAPGVRLRRQGQLWKVRGW